MLQRGLGMSIEAFKNWSDEEIEDFDRIQWWMLAPVLTRKEHHELDDYPILPFITFEANDEMKRRKEGGYSEVYPVRIHPSHHNFWEPSEQLVRTAVFPAINAITS